MSPVFPTRNTSLSVLLIQNRLVPLITAYVGSPFSRIISAGVFEKKTRDACSGETFLPGNAAFTSFQLSSCGSLLKLSGSFHAGPQPPSSVVLLSQTSLSRR